MFNKEKQIFELCAFRILYIINNNNDDNYESSKNVLLN